MAISETDFAGNRRFDTILRNGTIINGTGAAPVRADVGIVGERIAALGDLSDAPAGKVIDATNLYVTPGFIDIHTHSDLSLLFTPGMESSLAQGVTSEIVGNCGFSLGLAREEGVFALEQRSLQRGEVTLDWNTLDGFLRRVEDNGIALNIATLAGHGTLRKRVMGLAERLPTPDELTALQRELADAMAAGAVGLSSGLEYVPGMYGDVAELTVLAKVAAEAGGFYATHLRSEGDTLEESVAEAIAVAEGAGIPLQLSHHKAEKAENWGKIVRTLAMAEAARERGMDVLLDQYPYTAFQTGLATIALPPWAVGGTPQAIAERLRDPQTRSLTRAGMPTVDWKLVEIATCPAHREYQGFSVAALADEAGKNPQDWTLDLLAEGEGWVSAAYFALSETDVERVMSDPHVMIGSDAVAATIDGPMAAERPHPRTYGTFARVLSRYVREKGVLTWPDAIRRMTSLPAQRLNWPDRGRLAVGCVADITAFDPHSIHDAATFAAPHAYAVGVRYVLLAGTLALSNGVPTGTRTGKVLRRK